MTFRSKEAHQVNSRNMNQPIISVENLAKRYLIGRLTEKGDGLRHVLERLIRAPMGWLRSGSGQRRAKTEEFWALRDLNLEVAQGDVIGIIGRNGAGKSTLLKILSRITEPTQGRVRLRGRCASLLEVGTGFHPELTGRENIFLNGAILGMSRLEIKRRFDEIVAFSEINRFLDTPVKRYSSGMYVRLAFAVAAHLEPDILIVDEVLAVGDVEFQKKCLGKMKDVASQGGRTVLFVSHNMAAVQNLCTRGILLDRGRILSDGNISSVIGEYTRRASCMSRNSLRTRADRAGKGDVIITDVAILDAQGKPACGCIAGTELKLRLSYSVRPGIKLQNNCSIDVCIERNMKCLTNLSTAFPSRVPLILEGDGHLDFRIPELPLSKATYLLSTYVQADGATQDWVQDAFELQVVAGDFFGTGKNCHDGWSGEYVLVKHTWEQHSANGSRSATGANNHALS